MTSLRLLLGLLDPTSPVHTRAMHQIEETLSRNSVAGATVSILSSVLAQISLQIPEPSTFRHALVSLAQDAGIVVGLLIGCLTLAINIKKFLKEFFPKRKSDEPTTPRLPGAPSSPGTDQPE